MKGSLFFPIALCLVAAISLLLGLSRGELSAGDWPTYRGDNQRSGATVEEVKPPLELQWTWISDHPPRPAWPAPSEELPRTHADNAFHAIVGDGLAFFGSSVDDQVTAIDCAAGAVRWTFDTDGPVRFAPAFCDGRLYFGSDDGFVYCLNADDGALIWKYRAGPDDGKVIGNGRLISSWPVRTSVLVDGGEVFFCAGVFPFEGIFVCALGASDGSLIWKNDTVGDRAHELEYGGISPQAYLLASSDVVYVPSGRAMPAAFDRKTGEFLFYASPGAKRGGTWALLDGENLVAGDDYSGVPYKLAFDAKTGRRGSAVFAWFPGIDMAMTPQSAHVLTREAIYSIDRDAYAKAVARAASLGTKQKELSSLVTELRKKLPQAEGLERARLESRLKPLPGQLLALDKEIKKTKASSFRWSRGGKDLSVLILAKGVVYAGGRDTVLALDALSGEELWSAPIDGTARSLAASEGRLLVSTDSGAVACFGPPSGRAPKEIKATSGDSDRSDDPLAELYRTAAAAIAAEAGGTKGYCIVADCGTGRLACELARLTELTILGIETDREKVRAARDRLRAAGLHGARVTVLSADASSLPPYFANLVVSDAMVRTGRTAFGEKDLARVLRPCGGVWLSCRPQNPGTLSWTKTVRGDLEGAGSWTQLYGNPQNTACSGDELVKGPFGVVWFGEPGSEELIDRHGRSTSPVSLDGRVFHQGEEVISAFDAYNGTFLWKRQIAGAVRVRVDVDGGNLALSRSGLYVAADDKCYRLDPATGETLGVFEIPHQPGDAPARWGFVAVHGKILYGICAEALKNPYGAPWKDFIAEEGDRWLKPDEIPPEAAERWTAQTGKPQPFGSYQRKYPEAGQDLYMDYHRAGTLWRSMTDFPTWDSQRTPRKALTDRVMGGNRLFAMDAESGALLWIHKSERIPNISVSIAGEKVFFVESGCSEEERERAFNARSAAIEKGLYEEGAEARLVTPAERDVRFVTALDARTGRVVWRNPADLTGCGGDKMGSAYSDGVLAFFGHFSNHDTGFFLKNELTWRRVAAFDEAAGEMLWSRPLNYLRRPLIVGDRVIIEPRACDLHTGAIVTRSHPITGERVPWEFLRPGHCCSVTSASAHTLFYRSYWAAIYELTGDKGLNLFGAIRPGCWLNMITAGGLMIMPEASSGCTCSFPLRCSLAMAHKPEKTTGNWTVFVNHGSSVPVKHLAVNLGAPGDKRDAEGTLWLAWPRPRVVSSIGYGDYAMDFHLKETIASGGGYFRNDYRGAQIDGTEKPWLHVSGCRGLEELIIPLAEETSTAPEGVYTVRVGFCVDRSAAPGAPVFDLSIEDRVVLKDFDPISAEGLASGSTRLERVAVVREFNGVGAAKTLTVRLVPRDRSMPHAPVLNFIEVIREDVDNLPAHRPAESRFDQVRAADLLDEAGACFDSGKIDKALQLYHALFESEAPTAFRVKALEGMAAIASPESLHRVKKCWENSRSILSNYQTIDGEIMDATARVVLAVADRLSSSDRRAAHNAITLLLPLLESMSDQSLRGDILVRLGYVVKWRLVGPVPWSAGQNSVADVYAAARPRDDFAAARPRDDFAAARPRDPSSPIDAGKKELVPVDYLGEQAKIDLQKVFGVQDKVSAFALAEFDLATDQPVTLHIGSDDGFKCWFNGRDVGGFSAPRGWDSAGTVLTVAGREGPNRVLLQIIEQSGDWVFSLRVSDGEGNPLIRR